MSAGELKLKPSGFLNYRVRDRYFARPTAADPCEDLKFLDGLLPIKECGESLLDEDSPAAQQIHLLLIP